MNKPDFRLIGKPIPRAEDGRLITGKGRFTDDFQFDGQTYAAMVRSPYPQARIVSIDDIADALADLSQLTAATLANAASHALDPSDRAACTRPPALLDANSVRRQSNRPGSSVHLGQRPA